MLISFIGGAGAGETVEDALRSRVLAMIDMLRGLGDAGRDPGLIAPALARLDICGAPKNEEVKSMDEFAPLDGAAPNATVDLSALVKRTLQEFATDMPGSPMMGGMTSMVPCSECSAV